MKVIKQSATSVIRIKIGEELSGLSELRFGFFQGGNLVVKYTNSDDNVSYEDGIVEIVLAPEVSNCFSPGLFRVEIEAELTTGQVIPAKGVLIGRVEASGFMKDGDSNA